MPLTKREGRVTTTDLWKVAGLVFVLVDHTGLYFDPDQDWWRVFGRLAAPIFFFFIGFARSREVPWTWVVFGLILTATETWTSGEGLGRINLNILINFAYIRLLLPHVERWVMPHPWRIALLTVAIVLLIRPVQPVLEYGAQGWLWALFGFAHRRALEGATPAATRNLLAAVAALVYLGKEVADYEFGMPEGAVLAALLAALTFMMARFRRADLAWRPRPMLAALAAFAGRRSLEIYAVSLFAMMVIAYAWDTDTESEDSDEAA